VQAPAGRKIVVVNDDPSQLLLATTILHKDGLEVFPYENAEDALVGIRELGPPDLVITDLNMPGTGGWNFCRLLRSIEFKTCNRIPILIVSATYSGADTQRITADVGANKFLPAPYQPADLRNTVGYLLERFDRGRLIIETASLPHSNLYENSDYDDFNDPLAKVWERSKQAIMGRVSVLEQATVALVEGSLNDEMRRDAEREAHKLAGSVGNFGFPEGSRLARALENTLRGNKPLAQTEILLLCDKTVALRRALDKSPELVVSETTPGDDRPTLLVVDHDRELGELLAVEALARGMQPQLATDLSSAREVLSREDADVVLLGLSNSNRLEDELTFLAELTDRDHPVPVLILTASDSLTDRVEVARFGGRGFLPRSLPPSQVMEAVSQLHKIETRYATVMAVDDDPQILAILSALLETHHITLVPLEDPLRFWEVLVDSSPDLLMLDIDMPNLSGIELCQVVRNDPRWAGLPILFLTAHTGAATLNRVFSVGGDDLVGKPIEGPELMTRIFNRLGRTQLQRRMSETDALTGVASRLRSCQSLETFLSLAYRDRQPLCLAVLDLDDLGRINEQHGQAAGNRVLAWFGDLLMRTFHEDDVVARWGGGKFIVGVLGMSRDDGVRRLAEVLEDLRQQLVAIPGGLKIRLTFSCGVAQYPQDGTDLESLYQSAEEALCVAKASGCDRVLPVGWEPNNSGQVVNFVDIVMVDDDEALASLLLHALEGRGYRTCWLKDGQAAVDELVGTSPPLRAKLVLLDVDLPGVDGIGVLRRLARNRCVGTDPGDYADRAVEGGRGARDSRIGRFRPCSETI